MRTLSVLPYFLAIHSRLSRAVLIRLIDRRSTIHALWCYHVSTCQAPCLKALVLRNGDDGADAVH